MKLIFSLILLLSFLLRPTYEIANIAYYELNIDYVIENYCVNKAKPEMHCDGKCFLNAQLNKIDNPSNSKTSEIAISKTFIPAYFEIVSYTITEPSDFLYKIDNWGRTSLNGSNISNELEHPPNV